MKSYVCEKCDKKFDQKIDYTRHMNKKYSCIPQKELDSIKHTNNESLKKLDSFFNKIRDILRNNESITGHKALDVMTDLLLLKSLNTSINNNQKNMNFITKKYDQIIKVEGTSTEYDIDKYKKYFNWNELMLLVKEIDREGKNDKKELLKDVIVYVIFSGILKLNENTREIYKNKKFLIQKTTTIIKLLKEYDNIDFEEFDVDIKGKAYELSIQKEAGVNKDFSQFFTPRWIDKYMVDNANITIDKDGNYTKCLDPACGTAGILTEYLTKVHKIADEKDILSNNEVSKFIYGYEIVDDTLKIGQMNILLKSGTYNKNIKCQDFLEKGYYDFLKNKFDGNIITNPPFAVQKNYEDIFKNENIYPIKTKSGTLLFLQSCTSILKDNNKCIMISPNGREIFGKNKEFVNLRKHIVSTCNLYKIALLPSGSFKPYTGVETLILFLEKGIKTKEIQFVNIDKNKDDSVIEKNICKVKIAEIEKHNFSWNYKEYYIEKSIEYSELQYKNLGIICSSIKGIKQQSKNGKKYGMFPLYYCSILGHLYLDTYDYDGEGIIINKTNGSGKSMIYYHNGKYNVGETIIHFKSIDINLTKYVYYYLLINKTKVEEYYNGTNQKSITEKELFDNIQIPIPPLSVQQLIVKELDSICKEKECIQNSINERPNSRKVKFELLVDKCNNKKMILKDICENIRTGKNKTSDILEDKKKYPYYGTGGITGYTDEYIVDGDYILTPRNGTIGGMFLCKNKSFPSDHMFIIKPTQNFDVNFIFHSLISNNLDSLKTGSTIPNITKSILENIELLIPSLSDQQLIVSEMEKYDTLEQLQKEHILELDNIIKQRFDYHLSKCKKEIDTKKQDDSESEELEDEKPKKVKKKNQIKI
jgi:restriction endonuclease S subunit/uncharacterized C2H2 Zn-finger protein